MKELLSDGNVLEAEPDRGRGRLHDIPCGRYGDVGTVADTALDRTGEPNTASAAAGAPWRQSTTTKRHCSTSRPQLTKLDTNALTTVWLSVALLDRPSGTSTRSAVTPRHYAAPAFQLDPVEHQHGQSGRVAYDAAAP
jgi:hypothetical protein